VGLWMENQPDFQLSGFWFRPKTNYTHRMFNAKRESRVTEEIAEATRPRMLSGGGRNGIPISLGRDRNRVNTARWETGLNRIVTRASSNCRLKEKGKRGNRISNRDEVHTVGLGGCSAEG